MYVVLKLLASWVFAKHGFSRNDAVKFIRFSLLRLPPEFVPLPPHFSLSWALEWLYYPKKIAIVELDITNKRSNRNASFSLDVMRCGTYSLSSGFLRRHITLCLASVLAFQNFTLFQHDLSFNRTRRVWIVSPTSKGVSYLLIMVQHETKHFPRHETTEGSRFRDNSGRTSSQISRVCQNIDMVLTVAKLKGCVE